MNLLDSIPMEGRAALWYYLYWVDLGKWKKNRYPVLCIFVIQVI